MKRLLTAAIGIPFAILVTLYSPDWLLAMVVGVFSALMVNEFLNLASAKGLSHPGRWLSLAAAIVAVSFLGYPVWVLTATVLSCLLVMTAVVFTGSMASALEAVAVGLSALVYCALLFGFVAILDRYAILVLFGIIWSGDSAAYYGGRAFGRHHLAPRVSPKKTIEGAIAGLLGSIIIGTALAVWLLQASITTFALVSGATAIAGQIGDLAESALKRSTGVKDSSSILPGHGGILDRLDSLLFASPVFYLLLNS